MKRAGRIVYRLLSGLSLLLLLATAGVWVRSYWVSDELIWDNWTENRSFLEYKVVWCSRGGIRFEHLRDLPGYVMSSDDLQFRHFREPSTDYPIMVNGWLARNVIYGPRSYAALGFEWIPTSTVTKTFRPWKSAYKSLTLPLYFLCLIFALLPAHFLLRLRRRRRIAKRIAQGCCIACGYDLRASSGRCPECGREGQ